MRLASLVFCLFTGLALAAQKNPPSPIPVYEVHHAAGPIQIDGVLDEFDWLMAPRLQLVKRTHGPEGNQMSRERTLVAALWDNSNLYLALTMEDSEIWATIIQHDARLFINEECVEIFMDPDGDGRYYIELQVNSLGTVRDLVVDGSVKDPTYSQYDLMAKWDFQNLRKAIRIYRENGHDRGWTLEIAIPWKELSFSRSHWPPEPGREMRINFYRFERPRSGSTPAELSNWSPVERNFHEPSHFGKFIFR